MAQLTTDFKAALDYIAQAKRKQCLVPDEHLPEPWWTNPDIPYLGVGLSGDYRRFLQTGQWPAEYQVYATGWDSLDGVMIVREEPEFDADLRVGIAPRTSERSGICCSSSPAAGSASSTALLSGTCLCLPKCSRGRCSLGAWATSPPGPRSVRTRGAP